MPDGTIYLRYDTMNMHLFCQAMLPVKEVLFRSLFRM